MPLERAHRERDRLLRDLVEHARTRVPYYRHQVPRGLVVDTAHDLRAWPILDREALVTLGPEALAADGFGPANTRVAGSSGSSGAAVQLLYSEADLGYLRASYLWDMLACGMRVTDKIGYARIAAFRRHPLERFGIARNVHIGSGWSMDDQIDAFMTHRPQFLYGYPTSLLTLTEELRERRLDGDFVRVVLWAGENLREEVKRETLAFFGATGHEVYSSTETYTIGRTCRRGAMHLRVTDVVAEVEADDGTVTLEGGEGSLIVTRLHSQAMPLLRYRIGDRVTIVPNDCACGDMHTPVIQAVHGRVSDRVTTATGRLRAGDLLLALTKDVAGVRRAQFRQDTPGKVEMQVVVADGVDEDSVVRALRESLAPTEPELAFTVTPVDRIQTGSNGKAPLVISRL